MNIPIDHLTGSVLKVTASEKLDISQDLLTTNNKSISQLIEDQKESSEKEKENDQKNNQN